MFFSLGFHWCLVLISTATATEFQTQKCDLNTTSQTNNTGYYSNRIHVLESLVSDNSVADKIFLNKSSGSTPPDIAYGLYLCRADVLPNDCRNCLIKARQDINNLCPLSKEAVLWTDSCMLRYANFSMFSVMNSNTNFTTCNKKNISDQDTEQNEFQKRAMSLLLQLAKHVSVDQKKMFAYDELTYNKTENIYGYVQCTPDLSASDCDKCLQVSIGGLWPYCSGKRGGRVWTASCNVRFEIYKFLRFEEKAGKNKISLKIVAVIVAIVVFLVAICYFVIAKRQSQPITSSDLKDESGPDTNESAMITEDSIVENEVVRCIHIALLCVQEDDELRPSMASVVLMLNSLSMPLPVPENPPFVSRRRVTYASSEPLV